MIKPVDGFEKYEVSDEGEVFSVSYNRTGERRKLKLLKDKYGYLYVRLSITRTKAKHKTVHRLVAETFIQNCENKPQVNHINGIKSDNRIENLEWVTQKENTIHSWKMGLSKPTIGSSKLSYKIAEDVRKRLLDGEKGKDIAKEYGVYPGTISSIKRGVTWKKER